MRQLARIVSPRPLVSLGLVGLAVASVGLLMPRATELPVGHLWAVTATRGIEAEHYDAMEDMALAADAVIVGRLESIVKGPTYGEPGARSHFASIRLEVDEVLQGSLDAGWVLHHPMGDRNRVDELSRYISDEKAVYFLRSLEREMKSLGFSGKRVSDLEGAYRLVTGGAVINDDHGRAVRPLPREGALESVDGRNFNQVIADIRGLRN